MGRIVYDEQGRLKSVHPGTQPPGGFAGQPPFIQRAAELHANQVARKESPVDSALKPADFVAACTPVEPVDADARQSAILDAIGRLDAMDTSLWTAKDHKPTVPALAAELGWKPTPAERDRAWTTVINEEQPS